MITDNKRVIPLSDETKKTLGRKKEIKNVSLFAINPGKIEKKYAAVKANLIRTYALMSAGRKKEFIANGPYNFAQDKEGMKKYEILCGLCGAMIAYCWARNKKLEDWRDLHHVTKITKEGWHGAMAINISQVDGTLGFECTCGEDTRDFRGNTSLSPLMRQMMIEYRKTRGGFGHKQAAFITQEVKDG